MLLKFRSYIIEIQIFLWTTVPCESAIHEIRRFLCLRISRSTCANERTCLVLSKIAELWKLGILTRLCTILQICNSFNHHRAQQVCRSRWGREVMALPDFDRSGRLQVSLSQKLFFLQNMGRTCCVQKLFWMSETISVHIMFSQGLSLKFSCIELVIQWTIYSDFEG